MVRLRLPGPAPPRNNLKEVVHTCVPPLPRLISSIICYWRIAVMLYGWDGNRPIYWLYHLRLISSGQLRLTYDCATLPYLALPGHHVSNKTKRALEERVAPPRRIWSGSGPGLLPKFNGDFLV